MTKIELRKIFLRARLSTEGGQKPSYIHNIGASALKYETIGQVLKTTALKYPDRIALVSCVENTKITFAETLDKVIETFFKNLWT